MKQLYTLVLAISISFVSFAQNTQIQLELVNPSIGQPSTGNSWETTSNDNGLNAILNSYTISSYQVLYSEAHSDLFYDQDAINSRYMNVLCENCDTEQLILDLASYSNVVKYAMVNDTDDYLKISNGLSFNLVDDNIGAATGVNAMNIIETNDDGLNQIFSNFNVRGYELVDNPYNGFNGNKSIVCDCDADLLKLELESYDAVISDVYNVNSIMLLSVDEVTETAVSIYPNPFNNKVRIEINQPVENVMLYNILGKQVYKSASIKDLENFSSTLKSGVYLLKLLTSNGESMTKKLIKS
jgi:hypothetical protein